MQQRSPSNPVTGKMAHTELAALKTIQGEVFTHNVWCETYQDDLTKETVSSEHLADCQEVLPTWAQDSPQHAGKGISRLYKTYYVKF